MKLGGIKEKEYTGTEYMIKFILERSGYASKELLNEFTIYTNKIHLSELKELNTDDFVKVVVKEYNQLRKSLKMDYSKEELTTGVPEMFS